MASPLKANNSIWPTQFQGFPLLEQRKRAAGFPAALFGQTLLVVVKLHKGGH
jgi:hypothetical protein